MNECLRSYLMVPADISCYKKVKTDYKQLTYKNLQLNYNETYFHLSMVIARYFEE